MSATTTHSIPVSRTSGRPPHRSARPSVIRPALRGLAVFVLVAAVGLVVALGTGATAVFNVLVLLLFGVLWMAFAAALVFSPATLEEIWHRLTRLPLLVQALVWLLFLPIIVGLWIWQRAWAMPVRLALLIAIAGWNLFLFFPRG